MPRNAYPNVSVQDGDRTILFSYECWSNHQGEALVNVHGKTDADHNYLAQNRAAIADMIKQEEGLNQIHYYESQDNGVHTPIRLETNQDGRITTATPVHGASLSSRELNRQGQLLLDAEHQHNMNLAAHAFGEQAQNIRSDPGRGHD